MTISPRTRIWLLVLPAMCLPFFSSLFYFVLFSDHLFARYLYGGTKLFTLLWPLAALLLILKEPFPRISLKNRKHYQAIPSGVLIGVLVVALMASLFFFTPLGEMVLQSSARINERAEDLGFLEYYWSFAIFLSVIHSFIEEYYWRWFVFGSLAKVISSPMAHIFAGMSFAAHHVVIASQFFPLFWAIVFGALIGLGGIIWSFLYQKQETLAGAWVSHMLVDFGIMGIGYSLLF